MSTHGIVLVPGFFGFGTFGDQNGQHIDYFARVREELAARLGGLSPVFVTHEPPAPTGRLGARAAALFAEVTELGKSVDRIHLVGHSTGGVDVRHVTNPAYPIAGVSADERARVIAKIDSVVSVSAPFHGTPIARNLAYADEALLVPLHLLSILTSRDPLRLTGRAALALLGVRELVFGAPAGQDRIIPSFLMGVDEATAEQVRKFLKTVVRDTGALDDLTPARMRASESNLAATDHPHLASFVSVAPRSVHGLLRSFHPFDAPERRVLYALAHRMSTPEPADAIPPMASGPWIGGHPSTTVEEGANDGVVPAGSQTVGSAAAGLVYGDHLDVVGHFDAEGGGGTFFKSGAGFDRRRFTALWSAVADRIRQRTSGSPSLRGFRHGWARVE